MVIMELYRNARTLGISNVVLLIATGSAFWFGQNELGFVASLMFVVSISPYYFKAVHNVHIPTIFIYGVIIFIFFSITLGQFGGMYDRFHWYDAFLHFLSALVLGIVGFLSMYLFYNVNKLKLPLLLVVIFSFCFAVTIGVIWEIIEYFIDMTLGTNMQVSSLDDTMVDLMVNALGALISSVIGYLYVIKIPLLGLENVVESITDEVETENKAVATAAVNVDPKK